MIKFDRILINYWSTLIKFDKLLIRLDIWLFFKFAQMLIQFDEHWWTFYQLWLIVIITWSSLIKFGSILITLDQILINIWSSVMNMDKRLINNWSNVINIDQHRSKLVQGKIPVLGAGGSCQTIIDPTLNVKSQVVSSVSQCWP